MPQQVVIKDSEFLKMIAKGHTSAYTIFTFMKKQAEANEKERVITYKNIGERMLRLAKDGLIEEIELVGNRSIHGRRDYKISIKGIEQLIFSDDIHKEDIKTIGDYLDRYYPSERHHALGYGLMIRFADASKLLSEYLEYIKHPELKLVGPNKYDDLLNKLRDIERYEKHPKPKPKPKPQQQEIANIVSRPSKLSSKKKT